MLVACKKITLQSVNNDAILLSVQHHGIICILVHNFSANTSLIDHTYRTNNSHISNARAMRDKKLTNET